MREMVFHGIIENSEGQYTAICVELDIATEGGTLKEARGNLKEAVEVYLESVTKDNDEDDFIPRQVPDKVIEEYYKRFKSLLRSSAPSEFYEFSETVCAKS